jgi:hypothetical protein
VVAATAKVSADVRSSEKQAGRNRLSGTVTGLIFVQHNLGNEETLRHPDIFVCHGPRPNWLEMWMHFHYYG